ncbi:hypothetical protein CANARDRAFT_201383 [[Candida] arabinofermentans NRRL YB-2248]|uniref:Ras-GAP domain-containing protein n=1 Tax=[Candida] arabinofermentans NRRL YB-2248 TaxID=983967 RepID=A0A1E4SXA7_9ASCO|nr:hypothetical protein CANARDRAFT_201383 [[Candida] arabinofermentans NRRL YB-2248]
MSSKSLERIRSLIQSNQGIYSKSNVQWSYVYNELSSIDQTWNITSLNITAKGELISNKSLVMVSNLQRCQIQLFQSDFVIKITTTNKISVYVKLDVYKEYELLLSCLMIWQNLNPGGLMNKWNFNKSIIYQTNLKSNELLVCRFKIYGPLPTQNKKVKFFKMDNPIYPMSDEGWFNAIGYLKPNGILDLLCESDGSKLYSIDITKLYSSEIRQIHHSIFHNSNILFLGCINELRNLHIFKNEIDTEEIDNFIISENKKLHKARRIMIDFDLRIDLEDWLVTLSSFTKLEYIGNGIIQQKMRVVKNFQLEIVEANFTNIQSDESKYIYSELMMWNCPWFRTAIVPNSKNPFWKENFQVDLPTSTEFFKIIIKTCNSNEHYNTSGGGDDDDNSIVGTAFITPDVISTNEFMKKIPIYNMKNEEIGQLSMNLNREESHILPYQNYKIFEKMLVNLNVDDLLKFINNLMTPSTLESWSIMLLDIYQTLNKEHDFFESSMRLESQPIDSMTRDNRTKNKKTNSANGLNTIFRGNSILSKTLEKYALRIGQEYQEKLLGEFINKITIENKNCEVDPRLDPIHYKENYFNLLQYIESLWDLIYKTSNDLPQDLKDEWKNLRRNVEKSVEPNDTETPLNALSSFIFLRFLCPAILNPKLFNLTKNHQSGKISRTLTLIAKILMVFANRTKFQKHKEPFMLPLNEDFIIKHQDELLIYLDRVTGRKMDFNEKLLEMSNLVERPSLNISNEVLNELPTMPYLIDKYLMMFKLIKILDEHNQSRDKLDINNRNVKITDLKFEILGFDDTDFGSEEFIKNLLDDEDEEFNKQLLHKKISLKDLMNQSSILVKKTIKLEKNLIKPEIPSIYTHESWQIFTESILKSVKIDKNGFVVYDISIDSKINQHSGFDGFIRNLIKKNEITKSESIQSMITDKQMTITANNESTKNVFKKIFTRKKSII